MKKNKCFNKTYKAYITIIQKLINCITLLAHVKYTFIFILFLV